MASSEKYWNLCRHLAGLTHLDGNAFVSNRLNLFEFAIFRPLSDNRQNRKPHVGFLTIRWKLSLVHIPKQGERPRHFILQSLAGQGFDGSFAATSIL